MWWKCCGSTGPVLRPTGRTRSSCRLTSRAVEVGSTGTSQARLNGFSARLACATMMPLPRAASFQPYEPWTRQVLVRAIDLARFVTTRNAQRDARVRKLTVR